MTTVAQRAYIFLGTHSQSMLVEAPSVLPATGLVGCGGLWFTKGQQLTAAAAVLSYIYVAHMSMHGFCSQSNHSSDRSDPNWGISLFLDRSLIYVICAITQCFPGGICARSNSYTHVLAEWHMYDLLLIIDISHVAHTCLPGWHLCDLHYVHIFAECDL